MITEDQSAVIDFVESPATHRVAAVDRIDTHSALVFLAGELGQPRWQRRSRDLDQAPRRLDRVPRACVDGVERSGRET
jgi:hypothetical protein